MVPKQETFQLKRSLKGRHMFMISLGGVIGSGLFLGTGATISQAGPTGTVLAYIVGGLVMYLVMLCLGELSVAMPVSGSFQTYTTRYVGPATGFMVGWVYWLGWAVTVGLELTSAGVLMQRWFPHVHVWVWCLVFGIVLFALNALSAKGFGETEFWFAGIKVVVILLFIVLGAAAMFGILPMKGVTHAPYFSHFVDGGIFTAGLVPILLTAINVNFSYQGTELIGIAAGESENPQSAIPKSINNTVWRILIFFVLAIVVLCALIPWKQAGLIESPFVHVFDLMGIPYAADVMNFVIVTAVLSVANSGLYAATRMLWSLADAGMAPNIMRKVNRRGVPMAALIFSIMFGTLSLLSSVVAASTLYQWLLAIAGMGTVVAWIFICISQIQYRRRYLAEGGRLEDLAFRTPFFPLVPILGALLNFGVLVSLAFDPGQRIALYCGIPFMIICYICYFVFVKKSPRWLAYLERVKLDPLAGNPMN